MGCRTYIILHEEAHQVEPPRDEPIYPHLNEHTAEKVMEKLKYTDSEGIIHTTPIWTKETVKSRTEDLKFPEGTTLEDKWVAFNFFYADTCMALGENEAFEAGYFFYFQDEDAPPHKLYRYLKAMGAL